MQSMETGSRPRSDLHDIKLALFPLRALYGHAPAADFGLITLTRALQDAKPQHLVRSELA